MRKLVFHLTIACATFAFSTSLTNVWRSLTQSDTASSQPVHLPDLDAPAQTADEGELLRLYQEYGPAQTRHDQAFFERLETDDFILFVGGGEALNRTEDIKAMNDSPADIIYRLEPQKIEVHGNTAIVTSTMTTTQQGSSESWQSVDICVKREGRWLIRSTTDIE